MVHVGAGDVRLHFVSEGVAQMDGTLRYVRNTVHVRGQPLVQTVPVDSHCRARQAVEYFNLKSVSLAGLYK